MAGRANARTWTVHAQFPVRAIHESEQMKRGAQRRPWVLGTLVALLALASSRVPHARSANSMPRELVQAFVAVERGDLPSAEQASQLAVTRYPARALAWKVRGYVFSRGGKLKQAATAYARAVQLAPGDPVARNNLGATHLRRGQLELARQNFDVALQISPNYADARNNRGVVLERMGRLYEAETAYRKAAASNRNHPEAHNNLGAVLLRQGRVGEASAAFERALVIQPQFAAPALNLVLARVGDGSSMSDQDMESLVEKSGGSSAVRAQLLAMRASRLTEQKKFRQALPLYQQAVKLDPENASILNNLAVVEDQLGLDRDALMHLSRVMELDPSLRVAQNNVGIVHVHRGDYERAAHVFQSLLRQDPNFHRAHYNLGVIYAAQGHIRAARQSFSRAAALAPSDADAIYNLALLARERGGDPAAERHGYERALQLDPSMREAHLALGTLLADPETPPRLRDPVRAKRHLERFMAMALPSDREGRAQARAWLSWLNGRSR